jgi:SAM-dependent methyltransferase
MGSLELPAPHEEEAMGNEFADRTEHSAEYFGDTRDHWWNEDYLALLAERWRLSEVRALLDVGCGIGHWGRLVARHLPPDATVTGVDREPAWVERASAHASRLERPERFRYVLGDVQRLPFADASFDAVTCQTLLIHMHDPGAALTEMLRVAKPGALIAVAEPNNFAGALILDAHAFEAPLDDILALTRLQLTCERGKAALGEGHNSAGALLPGLFARLGLEDLQVSLNDKATAVIPPYDSPAERALVTEMLDFARRGIACWSRSDTLRFFLAGGGDPEAFEGLWGLALEQARASARRIESGTYECAGGSICYCISGRKSRVPGAAFRA